MTVLETLAILESATLECKKGDINTPQVREALDFLEPHARPTWLIFQYRHALDGHGDPGMIERVNNRCYELLLKASANRSMI
jgi:hypothetical protein